MRILVFGAGVIGSLYTVLLAEAGYDESVYARGRRLESLTRDGLLYKRKGKIRKAPVTTIMSYSAEVLNELAPKARDMLNIPREHYTGLIVGFGYPEIPYARGVQKDRLAKTHRYSVDRGKR